MSFARVQGAIDCDLHDVDGGGGSRLRPGDARGRVKEIYKEAMLQFIKVVWLIVFVVFRCVQI